MALYSLIWDIACLALPDLIFWWTQLPKNWLSHLARWSVTCYGLPPVLPDALLGNAWPHLGQGSASFAMSPQGSHLLLRSVKRWFSPMCACMRLWGLPNFMFRCVLNVLFLLLNIKQFDSGDNSTDTQAFCLGLNSASKSWSSFFILWASVFSFIRPSQ